MIRPDRPRLYKMKSVTEDARCAVHLTLERAFLPVGVAGKRNLGFLVLKLFHNPNVCHITHLIVLLHGNTPVITDTSLTPGHHSIARIVRFADFSIPQLDATLKAYGV
jgi:hypothetical protein